MRKALCLLVMLVLMTSCSKQRVVPILDGFACTIQAECDGTVFAGNLERSSGTTVLMLSQPSYFSGLTMTVDAQAMTVTHNDMTLQTNREEIPSGALPKVIADVFDDAAVQAADHGAVIDGSLNEMEYTLTLDETSGYPLNLAIPALQMTVRFDTHRQNG